MPLADFNSMWYGVLLVGVLGLVYALATASWIRRAEAGDARMREIAGAIRTGAMAFLAREYQVLAVFVAVVAALLWIALEAKLAISFVTGATLSILAGNLGMRIATLANARTAWAVQGDLNAGLVMAFRSGAVMGFGVVSLGLLGVLALFRIFHDANAIFGFSFGASSVALFARVGGGIYTKAADVGADLVGKVEAGIPEDDPRNPAVIADNVGDNVGDVAGMGADLFESYVGSLIAAVALGVAGAGGALVTLPFVLAALGIVGSLVGTLMVRVRADESAHQALNRGILGATVGTAVLGGAAIYVMLRDLALYWAFLSGLLAGIVIGYATEFYTSSSYRPTRRLAAAAQTGSATNIIEGLALGMQSILLPVAAVGAAILLAHAFGGLYGIAIAAVGMLSTLGITLATDSYGPVADNAAGIAEMAHLGGEVRRRAESLDAVGNTTAAIGKGFAIGSAALTALVFLVSYAEVVGLRSVDLLAPTTLLGLFIGGAMPFLFASFAMAAVGRAAMQMVQEVRRQFRDTPGLLEGRAAPDYARAVSISTAAAIREMVVPGLSAVVVPVAVGFLLGKAALAGVLAGSIVTGFMIAVMMANTGGAWDNAKKFIEEGHLGGKGSDPHKAAVVGDTVGDPFKDTAGPSLNILLKLMAIVSIVIAPLL
ncbi:MAG: sodium-translocating pyrophosphatase [Armatimonadota bacterium]|nr:sodium-translocating pyrophosphatase [Armatimonadota bacterium]MDR7451138.1 sodium-translocating pyrophosphatase [Armatimonadota bacterium]MDR7467257.1 sodium-translocating pyrophosphatase [Armatimonadota bacterium]MDR7494518.1 sodium-translocating pyrophosphatase [Armatimonadota bacterium]MDR7499905.1 sodium-translocating pyrophosphatase [Armatimonadota bacterium]